MASNKTIKNDTAEIRELIRDFHNATLSVPEFQRPYVWKPKQALRLLASLYNGYPIASLVVWRPSLVTQQIRPRGQRSPDGRPISNVFYWIVDGQQRITTLTKIYNNDDFAAKPGFDGKKADAHKIFFNPKLEAFHTGRKPRSILVSKLWDEQENVLRDLEREGYTPDEVSNAERVRGMLRVNVPKIVLDGHSEDDVVAIFDIINSGGTKVTGADRLSAKLAQKHDGFVQEKVIPFMDELAKKGFGRVNVNLVFHACAGIASIHFRRGRSLGDSGILGLNEEELSKSWDLTVQATRKAIELAQSEFRMQDMKILWSGYLLVPPIVLLASRTPVNRKQLAAWMAIAALKRRYEASSEPRLKEDIASCNDPSTAIKKLLKNLGYNSVQAASDVSAEDFEGASTDKNLQFITYVACLNQGALDFYTLETITAKSSINRHHIIPRARFEDTTEADTIANIAFIDGRTNSDISAKDPAVYLAEISKKKRLVLKTQCIPNQKHLWQFEMCSDFWEERRTLLAASLSDFLQKGLTA